MEYNIDNAELTATLTAVNLDAAVIGQVPLEVAIGESARIDVGEAINYIKTGTAEIAAAVQEGTAAFDLNAEQKTADFNFNASNKTAEYNQNAENQFDDYNANASNKLNAYNDNAMAKLAVFNQNASDKTTAFDNNANDKTDNYDQNAEYKTEIFNFNVITETQAFDVNATAKTTAFNENAAIKQAAVDASADAAAVSATTASASATTAKQYAIGVPSEPSGYSAKYWAEQTAQSLSGLQSDVAGIKAVIPASATASNKLTDKSYVDTADNNLQSQIDAITASSDVTDIVGTYAELQSYDTSTLPPNSIIKVLQDESRNNETTYYRWVITGGVGAWSLIGEEGPYYTISAADAKFATQTALSTGLSGKQDTLVSGTNIKTVNNQSLLGSGDLTVTASAAWGSITGTLSAQTDLQNALNAKANNADLATVATSGDYADLSGTPDLSNYVTLNTDQTISGYKKFSGYLVKQVNSLEYKGFHIQNTQITKGTTPSSTAGGQFVFQSKDGLNLANRIGGVEITYDITGDIYTQLRACQPVANSTTYASISVVYPASGSPYTSAPTPTDTTTTSGTQIATTGWVNSANNNVVHKTGNETIGGDKTFQTNIIYKKSTQDFTTTPTQPQYTEIRNVDKNNFEIGQFRVWKNTDGANVIGLLGRYQDNSVNIYGAEIGIKTYSDGRSFSIAKASDVNGSIVTTVNKSKAANGYFQLGNGLIIQWGTSGTLNECSSLTITLPKAFTSTNYSVTANFKVQHTTQDAEGAITVDNFTTTTFRISAGYVNPNSGKVSWIAIGY